MPTAADVFDTGYYWYMWLEGLYDRLVSQGVPKTEAKEIVYG